MIDRASFDQQISQIRSRYDKIIHQKEYTEPKSEAKAGLLTSRPEENNICFSTPIQSNKNQRDEQIVSFSKSKQTQELRENYKNKGLSINYQVQNYQIGGKKYKEERICLTSREEHPRSRELSAKLTEKQKILVERMKENEKILRRSKQLREVEAKGKNCVGFEKQTSLRKEKNYFEYVRAKDKENLMLSKKICLGLPQDQETQRSAETERWGRLDKTSTSLFKGKTKINEESTALKEKINFYSKARMEKRENFKKSENILENNLKDLGFAPLRLQARKGCQEEPKKQSDLKMKSVFQDTAKIQERIKALLSFH